MKTAKVYKLVKDEKVVYEGLLKDVINFFKEQGATHKTNTLRVRVTNSCNIENRTFMGYSIQSDKEVPFKGLTKSKVI